MKTPKKLYETPHAEIIKIEPQGILCASGGAATSIDTGGGTSNMGYTSGYDWSIGAGAGAADMGYGSGYGW